MDKNTTRLGPKHALAHLNETDDLIVLVYHFYGGHAEVLSPCLPDKDQPSHGTRNGPCDEDEILFRSSFDHGQSFHRDPLIPHLPGERLIFQHARGIRTATDRPRRTMEHGTVTGRPPTEIVALHDALKPFSL